MTDLLPEKANQSVYAADGKVRFCPHCTEPMSVYVHKLIIKDAFGDVKSSRTLQGYLCSSCDMISLNRKDLNEAIDILKRVKFKDSKN
jgi:transposase-like protein